MDSEKKKELLNKYSKNRGKEADSKFRKKKKTVAVKAFKITPTENLCAKTYSFSIGHEFLKNLRPVFKWATATYNITRRDLEFLLYLYPIGMFQRQEFHDFIRSLGMTGESVFKKLRDNGWVEKFSTRPKATYVLSAKAKKLCKDLHLMLLGEKKIPTSKHQNSLIESGSNIDKYYMNLLLNMNNKKEK